MINGHQEDAMLMSLHKLCRCDIDEVTQIKLAGNIKIELKDCKGTAMMLWYACCLQMQAVVEIEMVDKMYLFICRESKLAGLEGV